MATDLPQVVYLGREPAPGMIQQLQTAVQVHHITGIADIERQLAILGASVRGLVTSASVGAKAQWLQHLPKLEAVSSFGVGVDALDLNYLQERGIQVGYTPDVLNDCVADLSLGLMLDVTRRISASDRYVREGSWAQAPAALRTQSSKKRVGLYGMGRIGQEIATRCEAFKMPIAYYSRSPKTQLPYQYLPSLTALAEWADILVVIVPATDTTQGSVNRQVLQALGPSGYLINVARGSVINEDDLLDSLEQQHIAGAGLDVFYNEPRINPRFFSLDNVVLSPHAGSATRETRQAMGDLTVQNLLQYFQTGRMITPFNEVG